MSLISIGLSGLNASSAAMTTIGNNTANVDTLGYSRQQVMTTAGAQQNIGVGFIGTGTTLSDVRRIYNGFLDTQLQTSTSLDSDAQAYLGQASKLDSILSNSSTGISTVLGNFFTSLQSLSKTPTDSSARQNFLTTAKALTAQFNNISQQMKDQNAGINTQLTAVAGQVNALASSIADLNKQITAAQSSGGQPNTLLDSRNEAVRQLNELVGAKVVETNGNYDVYIGTGQPLVTGSKANVLSAVPSDSDPTVYALKLNYQNSDVDVSGVVTGGTLGGLLRYRSDVLQPAANELGRLALVTSDQVNQQLNQGVDANGDFGSNLFLSINDPSLIAQRSIAAQGNSSGSGNLNVTISNTGALTTNDYQVTFTSATGYSVKRLPDGKAMGSYDTGTTPPPVIDGFSMTLSGTVQTGDSFKISPTGNAASGIQMVMTDPKDIATAAPLTGTAGANKGTGTFSQPSLDTPVNIYNSTATTDLRNAMKASTPMRLVMGDKQADGSQSYTLLNANGAAVTDASGNPVTGFIVPGASNDLTLNVGYTDSAGAAQSYKIGLNISGSPESGDTYSIALTGAGSNDNRNAESTLALQTKQTVDTAAGNGTGMSLSAANSSMITTVGSKAAQAKNDATATTAVLTQAKSSRDSVSGVSLDEEAANLVKYQQYYTASSQIIKAAQAIFSTLINSL
ncbi:flagellar hook-associated protein FlgK [Pseudomonas sp. GD03842]|uniref:flagellar hook-associated protein FlgK n=1 Tax=Pseudomonas sp. GD03842 TaxID=2975385 RepID=UPI00244935E7|nr:flagellar hook-associated protein FlgK [Pseudomonas sp. GD03842]MDH0749142.1 flagellar hook-associated protein FlgK [Pseudomonas sp. GD03842]